MMELHELYFTNANSRDTYFNLHHIPKAHQLGMGKGIKIGVIDWLFGAYDNASLYEECVDISGEREHLYHHKGHGLTMAHTLREIAPECSIFAINGVVYSEHHGATERVELLEKSIDWAIENRLDILTYSHPGFTQKERLRANNAVEKAVQSGLITTFIHNDSEHNIWPYGCMPFQNGLGFGRQPDVNIYHFDYNTLFLPLYERYQRAMEQGEPIKSGNDLPYFSFSSMSVVLGGFVAILKGLNSTLTSVSCKQLLRQTSYAITQQGQNWYDCNPCENVVNLEQAARTLLNKG